MPHRTYLQALDEHLDLIRWWQSDTGHKYASGFVADVLYGEHELTGDARHQSRLVSKDLNEFADNNPHIADDLVEGLNRAETYVVSDEMVEMVKVASKTFPREAVAFALHDMPSVAGFVTLETPILIPDLHGKLLSVDAFTWWPTRIARTGPYTEPETFRIVRYTNDPEAETTGKAEIIQTDLTLEEAREHCNRDDTHGEDWFDAYEREPTLAEISPAAAITRELMGGNLKPVILFCAYRRKGAKDDQEPMDFPCALEMWAWFVLDFDTPVIEQPVVDDYRDVVPESIPLTSLLKVFFTLIQQKVPRTERIGADRGLRRRMQRAVPRGPVPEVKVITLRKERDDHKPIEPGLGEPQYWTHRWVVSGFWRNQWYPSLKRHQPIWIHEYIKGPADKPLIIKDKVFRWQR